MELSRQEYWSGWSFPSLRDLPNPGTEPGSAALQADSLPSEPPGIRLAYLYLLNLFSNLGRSFNLDDFKAYYPPSFLGGPWQSAILSEHYHILTFSHPLRFWRLVKSSGPFQILPDPGETIIFVRHLYNTLSSEFHALYLHCDAVTLCSSYIWTIHFP